MKPLTQNVNDVAPACESAVAPPKHGTEPLEPARQRVARSRQSRLRRFFGTFLKNMFKRPHSRRWHGARRSLYSPEQLEARQLLSINPAISLDFSSSDLGDDVVMVQSTGSMHVSDGVLQMGERDTLYTKNDFVPSADEPVRVELTVQFTRGGNDTLYILTRSEGKPTIGGYRSRNEIRTLISPHSGTLEIVRAQNGGYQVLKRVAGNIPYGQPIQVELTDDGSTVTLTAPELDLSVSTNVSGTFPGNKIGFSNWDDKRGATIVDDLSIVQGAPVQEDDSEPSATAVTPDHPLMKAVRIIQAEDVYDLSNAWIGTSYGNPGIITRTAPGSRLDATVRYHILSDGMLQRITNSQGDNGGVQSFTDVARIPGLADPGNAELVIQLIEDEEGDPLTPAMMESFGISSEAAGATAPEVIEVAIARRGTSHIPIPEKYSRALLTGDDALQQLRNIRYSLGDNPSASKSTHGRRTVNNLSGTPIFAIDRNDIVHLLVGPDSGPVGYIGGAYASPTAVVDAIAAYDPALPSIIAKIDDETLFLTPTYSSTAGQQIDVLLYADGGNHQVVTASLESTPLAEPSISVVATKNHRLKLQVNVQHPQFTIFVEGHGGLAHRTFDFSDADGQSEAGDIFRVPELVLENKESGWYNVVLSYDGITPLKSIPIHWNRATQEITVEPQYEWNTFRFLDSLTLEQRLAYDPAENDFALRVATAAASLNDTAYLQFSSHAIRESLGHEIAEGSGLVPTRSAFDEFLFHDKGLLSDHPDRNHVYGELFEQSHNAIRTGLWLGIEAIRKEQNRDRDTPYDRDPHRRFTDDIRNALNIVNRAHFEGLQQSDFTFTEFLAFVWQLSEDFSARIATRLRDDWQEQHGDAWNEVRLHVAEIEAKAKFDSAVLEYLSSQHEDAEEPNQAEIADLRRLFFGDDTVVSAERTNLPPITFHDEDLTKQTLPDGNIVTAMTPESLRQIRDQIAAQRIHSATARLQRFEAGPMHEAAQSDLDSAWELWNAADGLLTTPDSPKADKWRATVVRMTTDPHVNDITWPEAIDRLKRADSPESKSRAELVLLWKLHNELREEATDLLERFSRGNWNASEAQSADVLTEVIGYVEELWSFAVSPPTSTVGVLSFLLNTQAMPLTNFTLIGIGLDDDTEIGLHVVELTTAAVLQSPTPALTLTVGSIVLYDISKGLELNRAFTEKDILDSVQARLRAVNMAIRDRIDQMQDVGRKKN